MNDFMVYFENDPFTARVPGEDGKPIQCECTPMVCSEEGSWGPSCGIGIRCVSKENPELQCKTVWGLIIPRNIFASWRATEMLRLHIDIGDTTLCSTWYAAERSGGDYDLRHTKSVIEQIGQEVYDKIMCMPVPEQIIRIALDNPSHWDTGFIISEVRAGTIIWRQGFADAGIRHPNEIDAERAARKMANRPLWKKMLRLTA